MHNPIPALENDSYKLLWDFNIQTDHLITARRPVLRVRSKSPRYPTNILSTLNGPHTLAFETEWVLLWGGGGGKFLFYLFLIQ